MLDVGHRRQGQHLAVRAGLDIFTNRNGQGLNANCQVLGLAEC